MGAIINNKQVLIELEKNTNIQIARDKVPNELAEKIVPVFETNPLMFRRINVHALTSATNAISATIYTTPTDKDFYLTDCSLSVVKDVTSTSISSAITIKLKDGVSLNAMTLRTTSLTVESGLHIEKSFNYPILLERGSTITVTNSTNVANITSTGIIFGYTVENT